MIKIDSDILDTIRGITLPESTGGPLLESPVNIKQVLRQAVNDFDARVKVEADAFANEMRQEIKRVLGSSVIFSFGGRLLPARHPAQRELTRREPGVRMVDISKAKAVRVPLVDVKLVADFWRTGAETSAFQDESVWLYVKQTKELRTVGQSYGTKDVILVGYGPVMFPKWNTQDDSTLSIELKVERR